MPADRPPLPPDLPVLERHAVRVVVQDRHGDVLLLSAKDGTDPGQGTWWELPGGGIDAGETVAQTAARELQEETGLLVDPTEVGPATWRRHATFRYRGRRHLQHEVVVLVRLLDVAPALDGSGRTAYEAEDYPEHRWWPVADLRRSTERFYPGRLPLLVADVIAGRQIDEPFEFFS